MPDPHAMMHRDVRHGPATMALRWHLRLVRWFEQYHRPMPWRSDPSPYKVWISEIMLQQTQVATVIPYFDRFVARFPTIRDLAQADQADVLRLWEGLGYYARARSLHKAAQVIVREHQGVIPTTAERLLTLPGIGPYTAAAIASIAYGEAVPSVDGNVLRVFTRFWGMELPIRDRRVCLEITRRLQAPIRDVNPSHFNQAIMETGALICRPRRPLCGECLLADECVAFKTDRTTTLPVTVAATTVPHHAMAVGVIWKRGRVLIAQRHEKQMLGGLWEFPGGEQSKGELLEATAKRTIHAETGVTVAVETPLLTVKHAYSHFRITLSAFTCRWIKGTARPATAVALKWVKPGELAEYPLSRVNRRVADAIVKGASPVRAGVICGAALPVVRGAAGTTRRVPWVQGHTPHSRPILRGRRAGTQSRPTKRCARALDVASL